MTETQARGAAVRAAVGELERQARAEHAPTYVVQYENLLTGRGGFKRFKTRIGARRYMARVREYLSVSTWME